MPEIIFSPLLSTEQGFFCLSSDGKFIATRSSNSLVLRDTSTLDIIKSYSGISTVKLFQFSPDSKHMSFITSPNCLKLLEVELANVLEIPLRFELEIIKLIWNQFSDILLCISELEVYIYAYDLKKHKNFTLEGCSTDDFGNPLCQFSPNQDYLCFIKSGHCYIYCLQRWTRVMKMKCDVFPTNMIFSSPYVVSVSTNEGSLSSYSILCSKKVHSENFQPDSCVKALELSHNGLILAAATYKSSIYLIETVAFQKLIKLKCEQTLDSKYKNVQIWEEKNVLGCDTKMEQISISPSVKHYELKFLKNINDEFKAKGRNKFFICFNHNDSLIATYDPGIPQTVWVWCPEELYPLKAVIVLQGDFVNGLVWNSVQDILAIQSVGKVIFWEAPGVCSLIHDKSTTNFSWVAHKKQAVAAYWGEKSGRFFSIS